MNISRKVLFCSFSCSANSNLCGFFVGFMHAVKVDGESPELSSLDGFFIKFEVYEFSRYLMCSVISFFFIFVW